MFFLPPIISDHHQTIIQHENRDFNVFYKKCFLTLKTHKQADNSFSKILLYEKESNDGIELIHDNNWRPFNHIFLNDPLPKSLIQKRMQTNGIIQSRFGLNTCNTHSIVYEGEKKMKTLLIESDSNTRINLI